MSGDSFDAWCASAERDCKIIVQYTSGATLRRIALDHGVTHERVRQILNGAGVPIRGRGYRSDAPLPSRSCLSSARP